MKRRERTGIAGFCVARDEMLMYICDRGLMCMPMRVCLSVCLGCMPRPAPPRLSDKAGHVHLRDALCGSGALCIQQRISAQLQAPDKDLSSHDTPRPNQQWRSPSPALLLSASARPLRRPSAPRASPSRWRWSPRRLSTLRRRSRWSVRSCPPRWRSPHPHPSQVRQH